MAVAAQTIEAHTQKSPEILVTSGFEAELEEIRSLPETAIYAPQAIRVAELPGDGELTRRAQQDMCVRNAGGLALAETVSSQDKPIQSLMEGLALARSGNQEASRMVKANVRADAMERIFKAGNIISASLSVDGAGNISQHGQRMEDIQHNALKMASGHPIIMPRTIAEGNNRARIKDVYSRGLLKDYVFLTFSICPEAASDEALDELNFFSLTKSISVQMTTQTGGGLIMESAFVAGVADKRSERHDRQVVEKTGALFGADYKGKNEAQIIDMPLLVPKSFMPNGVVDIVRLMDTIKGGVFFGQDVQPQDYASFKNFCARRQAGFEQNIEEISRELIAWSDTIKDESTASIFLGKLVGQRMVERAMNDTMIDSRVFGTAAAEYIEAGRQLIEQGMNGQAMQQMILAQKVETSGSCPAALNPLALLSLADLQGYLLAKGTEAIIALGGAAERGNNWHGGLKKAGKCVNCNEHTEVGVKSWCRPCVKGKC